MASPQQVTRSQVRERLVCLLHEIAGIPPDQVTDEATIDEELQMQSVVFVELQVAIEEEFHTEIDPIQVAELNQFGSIVDYVQRCAVRGAS